MPASQQAVQQYIKNLRDEIQNLETLLKANLAPSNLSSEMHRIGDDIMDSAHRISQHLQRVVTLGVPDIAQPETEPVGDAQKAEPAPSEKPPVESEPPTPPVRRQRQGTRDSATPPAAPIAPQETPRYTPPAPQIGRQETPQYNAPATQTGGKNEENNAG